MSRCAIASSIKMMGARPLFLFFTILATERNIESKIDFCSPVEQFFASMILSVLLNILIVTLLTVSDVLFKALSISLLLLKTVIYFEISSSESSMLPNFDSS